MNCIPGDMARIVNNSHGMTDRLVWVDEPYAWKPGWWACSPISRLLAYDGRVSRRFVIADDALRPIRDPGEDATDETLQWLPVPQTETV